MTDSHESMNLKFYTPIGRKNVRQDIDDVLREGTISLRGAVCFFTEAGHTLLKRHASRLQQRDSFFVASVDSPTNLGALSRLHSHAPGRIYIHLGGVTPEEVRVGRSLMHSKVFLSQGDTGWKLWVGSHNLTASAIAGGNFEAASLFKSTRASSAIQDAIDHLEVCRSTAEPFDPASMDRYKAIQKRRSKSSWESDRDVLVIHAVAHAWPNALTFNVRVQIAPTELDRIVRSDRPVRLFLHPPGAMAREKMVDYKMAQMWLGTITAVVRTELHPTTPGARGEFGVDYEIDIPDVKSIPIFVAAGTSRVQPCTQAVIRVEGKGRPGDEFYSVSGRSPLINALDCGGEQELHEIDKDMARFFTAGSLKGLRLLYRPVAGVRQDLVVRGYKETIHSRPEHFPNATDREGNKVLVDPGSDSVDKRRIEYIYVKPKRPIDPYFFISHYVIRSQ